MGEVMMSRENGMELRVQETGVEMEMARMGEKGCNNIAAQDGGAAAVSAAAAAGSSETVRWERFLPKMVVRVLLVEADDSTRQIISALLRKCSYRVAAVSDGLKAWEVLKGRSHNIDLILTEVDLPSISGYALLSLIMEHEICKNIPVIMMSSQDSVSTVYKCMLRGATDFLVKPLRKNELRNLWQHVWRKQASNTAAGLGPPDESVAQEKDEATAENNATSNHSSGYMSCIQRNKEGIEKGSDAQSSCTKPGSETEEEDIEHIHGPSKPESVKCVSEGVSTPGQEECHQQYNYNRALESEAEGFQVVAKSDADYEFTREEKNSDYIQEQSRASDIVPETFLREAIDLIGTFDNHFKGTFGTPASISSASKFDILPMLDLSLRRSHTSGFVSEVNDERTRLNHSDASAFSRYINKPLQLSNSTSPSTCSRQMDHEMNSEKQTSNHYSDTHGPMLNSPSMPSIQIGQPEFTFSYSQNRDISHPIPVGGVRFGNVISPYGSMMPSTYCAKSGSPPLPSQGTTPHSESFPQSNPFYPSDHQASSSQQLHSSADQRNSNPVDQTENKQGNKLENFEDQGLISHGTTNQNGNNSFCNGNISHHQSQGSGCNGAVNAVPTVNVTSECGSGHEETFHLHEGASNRAMQREAALTKFRQKRKDRCFEKKVRYESRKKLAEQRPRVKGQFVRQLPNDQAVNSSAS